MNCFKSLHTKHMDIWNMCRIISMDQESCLHYRPHWPLTPSDNYTTKVITIFCCNFYHSNNLYYLPELYISLNSKGRGVWKIISLIYSCSKKIQKFHNSRSVWKHCKFEVDILPGTIPTSTALEIQYKIQNIILELFNIENST